VLTAEERSQAEALGGYFIVWYEDRFSREDSAYPIAFHRSRQAAEQDAASRRGTPSPGNFERWEVTGPHHLLAECDRGLLTASELRARLAALAGG